MKMMERRRQTQQEFFETYTQKCSKEFLAEKSYVLIHTAYLKKDVKIKVEIRKDWQHFFGSHLTDEAFNYILSLAPVMLRYNIVEETRNGQEINSFKFVAKTVIALEFDLWLIEKYQADRKLILRDFEAYIHEKYGNFLNSSYDSFVRQDLKYIEKYENLSQALQPYYSEIQKMFQLITHNNRMKLEYENENADRIMAKADVPVQKTINLSQSSKDQGSENEYRMILKEKEERIAKLENDIKEYKRQRDEAREYSANQYEKGIKDLFGAMNDVRYGKVIDYLYSLLHNPDTEDNLVSYLDNLFMAFEDMEIEPMIENGNFNVKEENLVKMFNLDFDKSEYKAENVALKYAGWKYKDIPMEKPTLTLKQVAQRL